MHKLNRAILPFLLAVILALSGCENLTPQQQAFADDFATWGLFLPDDAVAPATAA